jgi:hypothetical protein
VITLLPLLSKAVAGRDPYEKSLRLECEIMIRYHTIAACILRQKDKIHGRDYDIQVLFSSLKRYCVSMKNCAYPHSYLYSAVRPWRAEKT